MAAYSRSLGHTNRHRSKGDEVDKRNIWRRPKWMENQHQGNCRGQSTLTSHTNLATLIPDHVKMGGDGQWLLVNRPKAKYHE